jgi:hypothetical protein
MVILQVRPLEPLLRVAHLSRVCATGGNQLPSLSRVPLNPMPALFWGFGPQNNAGIGLRGTLVSDGS